jgi:hypothetical protein
MKKVVIMQIFMEGGIMEVSLLKGVPPQPHSIYRAMNAIVKDSINNLLQILEGYQAVTSNIDCRPMAWKVV